LSHRFLLLEICATELHYIVFSWNYISFSFISFPFYVSFILKVVHIVLINVHKVF
jgi:hypothetical protein